MFGFHFQLTIHVVASVDNDIHSPLSDPQFHEGAGQSESDGQVTLPRTVGVRCRWLEGSRRRSERVQEGRRSSFCKQNHSSPTEPLIPEETEVLVESLVLNDRRG